MDAARRNYQAELEELRRQGLDISRFFEVPINKKAISSKNRLASIENLVSQKKQLKIPEKQAKTKDQERYLVS